MANQAAKKAQRSSVALSAKLQKWIVSINVVYIVYRLLWLSSSVTTWTLVGHAFLVGTTYLSYSWVISAAEEGGTSEYAMDVLIITLFTQAGLLISDYFWFAFLAIPGYVLYLGSGMLKNYIFTPTAAEEEVDDPDTQKKKEKAERRASRPKFKAGR